jgi:hypothetical protein
MKIFKTIQEWWWRQTFLKPLERLKSTYSRWPNYCPNCHRFLGKNEGYIKKYCYPGGDVRYDVDAKCKGCGQKFKYRHNY